MYALIPRSVNLPSAAHRDQIVAAWRHGHCVHSAHRTIPRTSFRLLGFALKCAGAAAHYIRYCCSRLCFGGSDAWKTGI